MCWAFWDLCNLFYRVSIRLTVPFDIAGIQGKQLTHVSPSYNNYHSFNFIQNASNAY